MTQLDGRSFEDEVRRVARALWPSASMAGARIIAGKERDGVFETEEAIHVLECTTWGTKEKAQKDISKIREAIRHLQKADKPAVGWFVTSKEPTADQRSLVRPPEPIRVMSFEQFRSKLIDSMGYLQMRDDYPFGSARDPASGSIKAPERYVPLGLMVEARKSPRTSVAEVAASVAAGGRVLLLGDYGAGKSMTLREVYRALSLDARKSRSTKFPLHLNLRDHQGQTDPVEVLERHARQLGFPVPTQLVRAWRAGQVHLCLDGFDEIATMGWQGPTKNLRTIRRRSVSAIREFVRESPPGTGIVIAGREHFFDGRGEMLSSFDAEVGFEVVHLSDFTAEEVSDYISSLGWSGEVPDWVPGRPLLLAYLVSRGLLQDVLDFPAGTPAAVAWHHLLDRICEREALIEAGIDATTVRRILERLATIARRTASGVGPVFFDDIERSFREIVLYPPDEAAMVLLQRLPGLGTADAQDQSRRFVDDQLVDAARAGDIVEFVRNPFGEASVDDRQWQQLLGTLGVQVAALRVAGERQLEDNLVVSLNQLARSSAEHSALSADVVRVLGEVGSDQTLDRQVFIESVVVPEFIWGSADVDLRQVLFRDCLIERLELPRDSDSDSHLPSFERCHIATVEGRLTALDMPGDRFLDCDFGEFSDVNVTTGGIMATTLPKGTRVVMTILKKLYRQRGSARKEGALTRGLDLADRPLVDSALDLLKREGLAVPTRVGADHLWAPVRKQSARANAILDSPTTCGDPAIDAAARL